MARFLALALAMLVACAPSHAAQSTEKDKSSELGRIAGTITIEGKPAPGVHVQLLNAQMRSDKNVAIGVSDAEGHYELAHVPVGSYLLTANAPAYVLEGAVYSWPAAGKPISIGDGEAIEGMDLVLTPGGVITGRVVIADGTPAIEESVNLIRVKPNGEREGVQGLSPFVSRTDDRGVYRLFGLTPGRYIVALGRTADDSGPGSSKYARTYYPSVTDITRAEAVEVTVNGVAKGIDVTLSLAAKTYTVTGSAHYSDTSAPVTEAYVMIGPLVNGQLRSQGGYGERTDANGVFRISGLAPGSYRMMLRVSGGSAYFSEPLDFDVGDHDVTGLELPFVKGGTISGVAVLDEEDDPTVRAKLSTVEISAGRKPDPGKEQEFNFRATGSGDVGADGAFRIEGLKPGSYELNIWSRQNATDSGQFYVWSMDVGGTPSNELAVEESPELADVHVHLRYGDGRARGTVKIVGEAPAGARIVVAALRPGTDDTFNDATVDDRRQFLLDKLPTGTYDLVVYGWARGTAGWKRFRSKPTSVVVRSGTAVDAQLTIDFEKDVEEK